MLVPIHAKSLKFLTVQAREKYLDQGNPAQLPRPQHMRPG